MFGDEPPGWLSWANTAGARATTTIVAVVALGLSALLGIRQQSYINCVAEQQAASDDRTRAIAAATDMERAADAALVAGPAAAGRTVEQLRAADVAARAFTDRVREQNPPPRARRC
jgi:hypothetical protein